MTDIYVMTYRRKQFKALNLLSDPNVRLNLCVRSEEDDNGFYDELKKLDRIEIIRLGYDIIDAGDTREQILQYGISNGLDWMVVADDTVDDIFDNSKHSISEIINDTIDKASKCSMSDYVAMTNVPKRIIIDPYTNERKQMYDTIEYTDGYLQDKPTQLVILNLKLCKQYNLHYHPIQDYGYDDVYFAAQCLQKGLIWYTNNSSGFSAIQADVPKFGGTYENISIDVNDLEPSFIAASEKTSKTFVKSYNILNNMAGIVVKIKYSKYLHNYTFKLNFDSDYFRTVLIDERNKNQAIINAKFSIPKLAELTANLK